MKMTMLVLFATATLFSGVSVTQQLDGENCWPAYKKLQQHRQAGSCREDSAASDRNGGSKPSKDAIERAARNIGGATNWR